MRMRAPPASVKSLSAPHGKPTRPSVGSPLCTNIVQSTNDNTSRVPSLRIRFVPLLDGLRTTSKQNVRCEDSLSDRSTLQLRALATGRANPQCRVSATKSPYLLPHHHPIVLPSPCPHNPVTPPFYEHSTLITRFPLTRRYVTDPGWAADSARLATSR